MRLAWRESAGWPVQGIAGRQRERVCAPFFGEKRLLLVLLFPVQEYPEAHNPEDNNAQGDNRNDRNTG